MAAVTRTAIAVAEPNHYLLVCGGREFDDYARVREPIEILFWVYGDRLRIMHGNAKGADKLAGRVADDLGIPCKEFPADWGKYGRGAGPIRNREMLDYLKMCRRKGHSVQVISFPGGTGTADMVEIAESADINVDPM
jgi:hypothetical protein